MEKVRIPQGMLADSMQAASYKDQLEKLVPQRTLAASYKDQLEKFVPQGGLAESTLSATYKDYALATDVLESFKLQTQLGGLSALAIKEFESTRGVIQQYEKLLAKITPHESSLAKLRDAQRQISASFAVTSVFDRPDLLDRFRSKDLLAPTLGSDGILEGIMQRRWPVLIGAHTALMIADGDGDALLGLAAGARETSVVALGAVSKNADVAEPSVPSIDVEFDVVCAFCNEPLMGEGTRDWLGNSLVFVKVTVVPVCPECVVRQKDDPGYFDRKLSGLDEQPKRRTLTFAPGNAEGDGRPRGVLRLVPVPREPDNEG